MSTTPIIDAALDKGMRAIEIYELLKRFENERDRLVTALKEITRIYAVGDGDSDARDLENIDEIARKAIDSLTT